MVRMFSIKLTEGEQQTCLQVARDSILHGLQNGSALDIEIMEYPKNLTQHLASFVTLYLQGQLRGCIGALVASQPLIKDIAEHAYAAAFKDPRFPALTNNEFNKITIDISVLAKPEPIIFKNKQDLLRQIRPGVDGLIIEHGYNRGTFLPSVWEQLPTVNEFFQHLKIKAGLPENWWKDDVKVSRYETFSIS